MPEPSRSNTLKDTFWLNPAIYDILPPPPLTYPKHLQISLDNSRHSAHQFSAMFLSQCKPLLIGCDIGLPLEELIMETYNSQITNQLDPEDQILITEAINQPP